VSTLYRLVNELGLSLDELLGSDSGWAASSALRPERSLSVPATRGMVKQSASDRRTLVMDSGVVWERLTPTHEPEVDFLDVTYEIGGASSNDEMFVRHSGREYGVVVEGHLRVTVGFESVDLGPGDSIVFDSSAPHRLENVGDTKVHAIWVSLGRYESDPRSSGLQDHQVAAH
jgi:mannose-6-phosphate isomerase-like protein (cupin superfamily)